MQQRNTRRGLAVITSAIAVLGALGTGVAGQQVVQAKTTGGAVTFTSSRADADILAHYTLTPATRSEAATAVGGGSSQEQLPALQPKKTRADRAASGGAAPSTPNTVKPGAGSTPPTVASFFGQEGDSSTCSYFTQGCNPPDQAVAASPDFVIQGVNTQWKVFSTSGSLQPGWPVSAQQFFNVPNVTNADGSPCDKLHHSAPFLSDPRVLYDAGDQRFIAAMLQVEGGLGVASNCPFKTVYFIAVSQTSDPRGSWNVYEFDMADGSTFAADFTQIGFNGDAIFFSANMFNSAGPGFYAELFEANKAQMESGQANFTADGFRNLQGTGPGTNSQTGPFLADTVQPMQTLDDTQHSSGGADGLFLDTIDGPDLLNGHFCSSATDACKGLALWRLSNPIAHDGGGAAPTLTGTYLPDTQPFFFPPPADEPSCNACVDASDLRISATPVVKDGTIYAAFETGLNNGTNVVPAIEWAQVDTSGGHPSTTTGYFNFSGDNAATYGALMPEADGSLVMVYERMGHTVFPEARYVVRAAGQSNFTTAGRLLRAGEKSYRPQLCGTSALPVCRWGDYEAISFDGNSRIWFAGEFANTHANPNRAPWYGRNWSTWIGAIHAG